MVEAEAAQTAALERFRMAIIDHDREPTLERWQALIDARQEMQRAFGLLPDSSRRHPALRVIKGGRAA